MMRACWLRGACVSFVQLMAAFQAVRYVLRRGCYVRERIEAEPKRATFASANWRIRRRCWKAGGRCGSRLYTTNRFTCLSVRLVNSLRVVDIPEPYNPVAEYVFACLSEQGKTLADFLLSARARLILGATWV